MKENIQKIRDRIKRAAKACGRDPESVTLVAVTKTKGIETVETAIDLGIDIVGENYIQEAREKFNALYEKPVQWHFIGHLQSNKAKYAVRMFDLIHSVDSVKLAKEINKQAKKHDKIQKILVQVNISEEASKSGTTKKDTLEIIETISQMEHISIQGLMTMPPFFNAPDKVRPYFKELRMLCHEIDEKRMPNVKMTHLSMGMTGDFEVAIEEGATLVRIGTAIFGERQ